MTEAIVKNWTGEHIVPLEQALKPEGHVEFGTLEHMAADVEAERETIGKLLALLVERKVLGVEEACIVAGQKNEVQIYLWPH